jgi:hypothetical protein
LNIQIDFATKNSTIVFSEAPHISILHAALEINCPVNIIYTVIQEYCAEDPFDVEYLVKTPLQIAAFSSSINAEIFLSILVATQQWRQQRNLAVNASFIKPSNQDLIEI